jgi:ParB-like chromosome segregation protein Spo0J
MKKGKLQIEYVPMDSIILNPKNPRDNDGAVDKILGSIEQFDWTNPILVRKTNNMIIAGHTRWKAAKKLGIKTVPVIFLDMSEKQADAYMLADNKLSELAGWDDESLAKIIADLQLQEIDVTTLGFAQDEIDALLSSLSTGALPEVEHSTLAERFIVPPFSVLDARQGYWQARKRAWCVLGIKGEEGRGGEFA